MSQSDNSEFENSTSEIDLGEYQGERNEEWERHGVGKAQLPNGDIYEGEYSKGKRHGKGKYMFGNGAIYKGSYYEGKKDGQGTMIYPDGTKYEGAWKNNVKRGKGIYTYQNGDIYDGFWSEDRRQGHGKYIFNIEETTLEIAGKWQKGKLHGPAKINFKEHSFEGNFHKGMLQGPGKYIFPNHEIEQTGKYIVNQMVSAKGFLSMITRLLR
eukprot:gene10943-12104_t